jgi:hypothetical protein
MKWPKNQVRPSALESLVEEVHVRRDKFLAAVCLLGVSPGTPPALADPRFVKCHPRAVYVQSSMAHSLSESAPGGFGVIPARSLRPEDLDCVRGESRSSTHRAQTLRSGRYEYALDLEISEPFENLGEPEIASGL